MNNTALLSELRQRTSQVIAQVETLRHLPAEQLNHRPHATAWSALECLEHLNRYCAYYWPHLDAARLVSGDSNYTRGWLGNLFIRMVEPSNTKKQKTMRHMDPSRSSVSPDVMETFLKYQERLLSMLDRMERTALGHRMVPVEFMRFVRLKTGDILCFLITHQERHVQQALRAAGQAEGSRILVA